MGHCWHTRWLTVWLGFLLAGPGFGYVLQRDGVGRPMRVDFNRTPKLTYHLGTTGSVRGVVSNEWVNVRAAAAQWQAVPGTNIRIEEGPTVASVAAIPAVDGRVDILWVNPGSYSLGPDFGGATLALFSTQVAVSYLFTDEFSTDVILQAVILVRKDLDYTTSYSDLSANRPFLETIILHELGHVLGANHSPLGTATLWWFSGGGVNASSGLSADEVAFAQNVYGTTSTRAGLGKISGAVRLNNGPLLGAVVLAERSNGVVVSAAVTRANGTYELAGLPPGVYQLRATPLDPSIGSDASLVRGSDLDVTSAGEYALANTSFQSTPPLTVTVTANSSQVRDFAVVGAGASPLRITGIRQGSGRFDRANEDLALLLAPGVSDYWVGVFVPGSVSANAQLRILGDGFTYGATEVLPGALRQLTLVQVPVSVAVNAVAGPHSLELTVDGRVARAFGFLEVSPAFPDDNFDGLSDLFQRAYWSPFTQAQAGPGLDPDGDGYSNRREAAAGTNPLSGASHRLVVGIRRSAGKIIVNAEVGVGKSYQLYSREGLGSAWAGWGAVRVAAGEGLEWTDDRPQVTDRFYQVRLIQ